MEPVDRLAALLDGELSADETAALRAELSRDGELADRLAAMQRADAALDAIPPTAEPDGFEARLAARLAPEIAATIATVSAPTPLRPKRRVPRWVPAVSGAAAGLLVLAGTAVVLLPGLGADDAETMLAEDRDEAELEERAVAPTSPGPDGPVVVTGDRDLDAAAADELLAAAELEAVTDRRLGAANGRALASRWRDELGPAEALAAPEATLESAPDSVQDDVANDAMEQEAADAPSIDSDAMDDSALAADGEEAGPVGGEAADAGGAVPAEPDEDALLRCLDVVLAADADAIPVYLEAARFEGEPALVYGLVTIDPATGAYTRPEVWVVDRTTCEPRRFTQGAAR